MLKRGQWELVLGLLLLLVLVVFTLSAYAQQPASPHDSRSAQPDSQAQTQTQEMPPDSSTAVRRQLSTTQAEDQIQEHLKNEPSLAGSDLRAQVDDNSVTLTGAIANEQQRDVAMRIARSYAGNRQIVDKLAIEKWKVGK